MLVNFFKTQAWVGLKIKSPYEYEVHNQYTEGKLISQISFSYINKAILKKDPITASFVGQSGSYTSSYFTKTQHKFSPRVGLEYRFKNGAFIASDINSEWGNRYASYEINLKMGTAF